MDLKNAVAVCLISLFSATLVVLIARTLDSQNAARLEPQLASIVEELRALRQQGGLAAGPAAPLDAKNNAAGDGLVVYYFHSNTRCPTCQSIESQTRDTVQNDFASQLARGQIVWKTLNYEQPSAAALKTKFDVQIPVVVLAKTQGGEVRDWKRLDEVWALETDKSAFKKFIHEQIQAMLTPEKQTAGSATKVGEPAAPMPKIDLPLMPLPNTDVLKTPTRKTEPAVSGDSKKATELPLP